MVHINRAVGKQCQRCNKPDHYLTNSRRFKICSGCLEIHYCSEQCQLADWPVHKHACKNHRDDRVASKLMCDKTALKHYSKWETTRANLITEIIGQLLVGKLETHVVQIVLKYQPKELPPFLVQSIQV